MGTVQVELEQDLVDLLEDPHRPVKQAARELIVLELYRQGRQASERGIPYFQLDGEDLQRELDASKKL